MHIHGTGVGATSERCNCWERAKSWRDIQKITKHEGQRERERERCIGRYTESDVTIGIFNTGKKIESDVNYWDICTGRKIWLRYIGKEICVTKQFKGD